MQDEKTSIILGGGCFWCLEAAYQIVPGVISAEPGYAGGTVGNPGYEQVCAGNTGHAEVVKVIYDSEHLFLEKLLELFWKVHDPTSLNRQGADVGTQYRSAIYYTSPEQEEIIRNSLDKAQLRVDKPIVTECKPLTRFYPAEDYHRDYFRKHPQAAYCAAVIPPKIEKTKQLFHLRRS